MLGSARSWVLGLTGVKRYAFAFGMGLASALALAPYYLLPLMVIGFSALVWLMDAASQHEKKRRVSFFTAFWFAYGYMLVSIYWMMLSFMVHATGTGQLIFLGLAGAVGVMGLCVYLSLYAGLAGFIGGLVWRPGLSRVFVLAGLWAVAEYLRGHMLTGLPWNLPAQALAGKVVLAQLSAYIGPYGLSLLVLILAMLPAAVFSGAPGRHELSLKPLGYFVAAAFLILAFGFIRLSGGPVALVENVRIQIVQPSIRQQDKINFAKHADNFMANVSLSGGAALADLGPAEEAYVVWPENAAYQYLDNSVDALDIVAQNLPQNALLLSGALRMEEDAAGTRQFFNSFHVVADVTPRAMAQGAAMPVPAEKRQRAIVHSYDKHHLVPFGEFVPMAPLLTALGIDKILPITSGFTRGQGPTTLALGATKVAPIICYETIFPGELYPKDDRPDWLLVVTNDAWFGDSAGPSQHLDMARLRAIETGLPIGRSANTGISAMIDPYGRVLDRLNLYERGAIISGLPQAIKMPPYARFGDLIFLLLLISIVGGVFLTRRNST